MAAALAPGVVFAGRYRIVRLVAAGAMGAVHEVVHIETERHRALKVMHAHLFQSEEMRDRFKREARIAAKIESEHIVDVFDAGVDEATEMPFLVMELLRGEDLGARIKRAGRLSPAEAMAYLYQTALALERTHAASIVHRDLKPANLFLAQRDDGSVRVKILDFGIAKLVAEGATITGSTSSTLGTPLYMPPEQLLGGTKLTAAADIFALGMLAYAMLVGIPYWRPEVRSADSVIAFAMVAVRGPQVPAVQRAQSQGVSLPPGFDAWFARATALDPEARFRRATEAVQALGEVLSIPVGRSLASIPSVPSGPEVAPTDTAILPAVAAAEPAPERSPSPPSPEHDPRSPGLLVAGTSTGAAVAGMRTRPARPRRAPLIAGLAVLGFGVLLGAFGWLALRAGRGGETAAEAADAGAESPASPGPPPGASGSSAAASGSSAAASGSSAAAPGSSAAASGSSAAAPGSSTLATEPPPAATEPIIVPPPSASTPALVRASAPRAPAAPHPATPPRQPTSKVAPTTPRSPSSARTKTPPPAAPTSLYGRY